MNEEWLWRLFFFGGVCQVWKWIEPKTRYAFGVDDFVGEFKELPTSPPLESDRYNLITIKPPKVQL